MVSQCRLLHPMRMPKLARLNGMCVPSKTMYKPSSQILSYHPLSGVMLLLPPGTFAIAFQHLHFLLTSLPMKPCMVPSQTSHTSTYGGASASQRYHLNFALKVDHVDIMKPSSWDMRTTELAGVYAISSESTTFLGILYSMKPHPATCHQIAVSRLPTSRYNALPPLSLIHSTSSTPHTPSTSIPHTAPTPLPTPSLADIIHTRDLLTRTTCSQTNSLPTKSFRHYNDIDPIRLCISLNTIHAITPRTTPDPSTTHTSLLNECFLSAPLPFLPNCSWDLNKPPNSYHKAINRHDNSVWLDAMQREYDSLDARKAFERTTLPHGCKAIGVHWTFDYKGILSWKWQGHHQHESV